MVMKNLKQKLLAFFFPITGSKVKVFPNQDFILANLRGVSSEIGPFSTPFKFTKARILYADIAKLKESRKAL